jgi:hypothetical protein
LLLQVAILTLYVTATCSLDWHSSLLANNSEDMVKDSELLARHPHVLVANSDVMANDSDLLVEDSELLVTNSGVMVNDSDVLASDSELMVDNSDVLARHSEVLVANLHNLSDNNYVLFMREIPALPLTEYLLGSYLGQDKYFKYFKYFEFYKPVTLIKTKEAANKEQLLFIFISR